MEDRILRPAAREECRHRGGHCHGHQGATQLGLGAGNVFVGEELGVVRRILAGQDDRAQEAFHHFVQQKLGGQIKVFVGQLEGGHLTLVGQDVVDVGGDLPQIIVGHQLAEFQVNVVQFGGQLLGH